jgi:hypothetical protein
MFNTGGVGSTFTTGTGLGTSVILGGNPLLGGAGTNAVTNEQGSGTVHQKILVLASMPFGDSPLFRNLLPATGKQMSYLNQQIQQLRKQLSPTTISKSRQEEILK